MTQEEIDFTYFAKNQLHLVEFLSGSIDVTVNTKTPGKTKVVKNIGSANQDGYIRVWCNGRLRMKHRLLFWLYHGFIPDEVDHCNGIRDDNGISNLIPSNRVKNTSNKVSRKYKQLTESEVILLCKDIASGNFTITSLANKYNRSRCQIKGIMSKRYWKAISDQYF